MNIMDSLIYDNMHYKLTSSSLDALPNTYQTFKSEEEEWKFTTSERTSINFTPILGGTVYVAFKLYASGSQTHNVTFSILDDEGVAVLEKTITQTGGGSGAWAGGLNNFYLDVEPYKHYTFKFSITTSSTYYHQLKISEVKVSAGLTTKIPYTLIM